MIGAISEILVQIFRRKGSIRPVQADKTAAMLSSKEKLDLSAVEGATGTYLKFLNALTSGLFRNIGVLFIAVGVVVLTVFAFTTNNRGVEFFVEEEPDVAIVFISARGNLGAEMIRDISMEVETEILQISGIDNIVMSAKASGAGASGGGIDTTAPQDIPADVVATMQIELADYSERRKAAVIFEEIKSRTAHIAGIVLEIRKIDGGPPTGKDIRLQVKSTDYWQMVGKCWQNSHLF